MTCRMILFTRLLIVALCLAGSGCTPAWIRSEPLIEIDGHAGGLPRRHEQEDQGENDNAQ